MSNTLDREDAEAIAAEYGFTFAEVQKDFEQANHLAQIGAPVDCMGNPNNAERFFRDYLNDLAFESNCETQEALRNEERAHGSRYGDRDFDN
jgi:hypothetical protein